MKEGRKGKKEKNRKEKRERERKRKKERESEKERKKERKEGRKEERKKEKRNPGTSLPIQVVLDVCSQRKYRGSPSLSSRPTSLVP